MEGEHCLIMLIAVLSSPRPDQPSKAASVHLTRTMASSLAERE